MPVCMYVSMADYYHTPDHLLCEDLTNKAKFNLTTVCTRLRGCYEEEEQLTEQMMGFHPFIDTDVQGRGKNIP